MRLPSIPTYRDLNSNQRYEYIMQAKANGLIGNDYSVAQVADLYKREQLAKQGLDPDIEEENANTYLRLNALSDLAKNKQLGQEFSSIYQLTTINPSLAASYANDAFNNGYMTLDEIEKASKIGQDAVNDGEIMFDLAGLKPFYEQVKKEKGKDESEENIIKEARRRYFTSKNEDIFKDINSKIDNFYKEKVEEIAPDIEEGLNRMNFEDLDKTFTTIADGGETVVNTAYGDIPITIPGSNHWRAFKDTSVFDNFGDEDKKRMMARYLAYRELVGEEKAAEYLDKAMQSYVAQHRGWGKAIADVSGGIGTTAGLIIPEALISVGGLAYEMLGAVLPNEYGGTWAKEQASIMLTGRDLQGNEVEIPTWDESSDPFSWLNSRLNLKYLHKVSAYKNWDIENIRKADENGGVSKDAMYIEDPTKGHQFWQDALDMSDMAGQAIGQIALAYLTGGASLEAGAVSNMSRLAAVSRVGAEIAATTAPIAGAYAVGASEETYNTIVRNSEERSFNDAKAQFDQLSQTEEYKKQRKEAIDRFFAQSGKRDSEGNLLALTVPDTPENREKQEQLYDEQKLYEMYNSVKAEREQTTKQIAQDAALTAFRTDATLEALKYGYTTAMFGSWKLSNNANKLLEQNLGVKTYGHLTQDAAGKFSREAIQPLGIKKLTLKSPTAIATYETAKSAIIGGGFSNYTDDVVTGLAGGLALGQGNSALLREYDPEAYASTWYGDSEAARTLYIMGSGVQGAADMVRSGQPWHSFYIGVGGSFLGAGYRFRGKNELKAEYAQQNAQYESETGKKVSKLTKFRQGLNTYTQTLWSTYEDARMGVNRLDNNIKVYNETLDKRQDVLNEIASMRQGLIQRQYADNEMSFSDATLQSDNLALKLISIQHSLEANPLRQLDKKKYDSQISELWDIVADNVSPEKKEQLILSAYGAREQDKSRPLTDQRKDEIWEDIKANAKRFTDFSSDYYKAVDQLKYTDRSFEDPRNYPLLHQSAELMAKSERINRDIQSLSQEIGINIDTEVEDRTQGQLTEAAKKGSIQAATKTIEELKEQRDKAQEKVNELSEKKSLSEDESNELLKQQAIILRTNRAIPRLESEVKNLEGETALAYADANLTTNVIQLHNMLSSPNQYTADQQREIQQFRNKIGEKGVLYIEEMAKMQDQLSEMKDAQQALRDNPESFQALVTGLQDIREYMGQKAIYNTRLQESFNFLKNLPQDQIAYNAAASLTVEQFKQFRKENPELSDMLAPYEEMNTGLSNVYSLAQNLKNRGDVDEDIEMAILTGVQSLALQDPEYLLENGNQGIADMLEFIKAHEVDPDMLSAIDALLTDFKRVASVEQSTVAYTEYKIKQMEEQSKQRADELVRQLEEAEKARQEQARAEQESYPDQSQIEGGEFEDIDIDVDTTQSEDSAQPQQATEETKTEPTQTLEPVSATEELPAGVTRNSDGNIETMTAEEQAQQMGITEVKEDSMIDDTKPRAQEVTDQQEEVHGTYFNMYESNALNYGELVPYTEGPVYEWLEREGIKLGDIIDNELNKILQANPKVQLMKVKKDGNDANVASNVFLVVEYTDKVSKHHLPANGGVITSGGKRYLIIGTMWNTKAQDGTEAANLMQTTRNNLQRNGVAYFDANPAERFYVDQSMYTEVTTFYSGHIVHTINQESGPHTIQELLSQHNSTHTAADQMSLEDLGFGVITMRQGFYPVGPHSAGKIHAPQRQTVDKYGQVYVLVPAANGEIVPIFINPTVLSELRDSQLKQRIDTVLIPQLLSSDYYVRQQAISELCQLLCISGSITNPEGKGILIGTEKIPTVSLVNGKSIIKTFDVQKADFTIEEFRQALYSLNPRINLNLSNLAQPGWVQRYDEAGALMTDAAKLGTYGGKFYVAPINPATGQPIRTEQKAKPAETSSDYSRAQATPTMLPVGGQTYVLRDGRWVHQSDGSPVTDRAEQVQVTWAYRINTGRAQLALRQGAYDYYVMDVETDKPKVVAYNLTTRSYQGVPEEFANQVIAEERAKIERARAEEAAQAALEQEAQEGPVLTEEAPEAVEAAETETEVQQIPTEAEQTENNVTQEAPKAKNDFQLSDTSSQDRYSVDDILDSADDAMMDYADRIYEIIENKKATSEKWADFNMEDITAELERLGIEANNIDDIESWIDNLENCE